MATTANVISRFVTMSWTMPGDDGNAGLAADFDFFFINPTTGAETLIPLIPNAPQPGTNVSVSMNLPYRNASGLVQLRVYDKVGNTSVASVPVLIRMLANDLALDRNLAAATLGVIGPSAREAVPARALSWRLCCGAWVACS